MALLSQRVDGHSGNSRAERNYPMLDCALNKAENEFTQRWTLLFMHCELWQDLIPAHRRTVETRGLAGRMLSTYECLVEATLVHRNRQWKIKIYLLLATDDILDEAEELLACLAGPWLAALITQHRDTHTVYVARFPDT